MPIKKSCERPHRESECCLCFDCCLNSRDRLGAPAPDLNPRLRWREWPLCEIAVARAPPKHWRLKSRVPNNPTGCPKPLSACSTNRVLYGVCLEEVWGFLCHESVDLLSKGRITHSHETAVTPSHLLAQASMRVDWCQPATQATPKPATLGFFAQRRTRARRHSRTLGFFKHSGYRGPLNIVTSHTQ